MSDEAKQESPLDLTVGAGGKNPRSELLLHRLVKGATEYALLLLSPEETVIYWNEGARRLFGYEEQEILGEPVYRLFTPEDVELGVARKEIEKAHREGWADDERWHLRKDGARFWANGVVTCLKDDTGAIVGYSKVLRDQTLRKHTEDKLNSAVAELTQFNHSVSHDLQEPLRMVTSYLRLIGRRYRGRVDKDLDEFLATALDGAERLHRLLTDLLTFVRVDSPQDRRERTDSAALFDMAVSNLKVAIDESRAVVTRTSLPVVEATSTQLAQVFQNVIGNAIKYRRKEETPKIYADAHPEGDTWKFSVCDNGIGISEEDRHKVFEAFKRLHSKDEFPGTGLGLFLCKKIIERHGGRIWIDRNPAGPGTIVRFTLPKKMSGGEERLAPTS